MTDSAIKLEWVRQPLQARSQQTLARILDAAEAIIDERGIDAVTVADVARRAESSVGSFYSRFSDKEALLRCVLQRFTDQAIATAGAVLEPGRWDGVEAADALEAMMLFMLRILRERSRLIWALTVRASIDPEIGALGPRLHQTIADNMHALIVHRGHGIAHPEPATAIRIAVWLVLSAMEARALHGDGAAPILGDETVAHELAQMVVRYIGLGERPVVGSVVASSPHELRARPKRARQTATP